jgi:hypothetical protein
MMRTHTLIAAMAMLTLVGPRVQAQHLWWDLDGQQEGTCLYGNITVLATHRDIYYAGANWHPGGAAGGYCGIQHNTEKERRTIFSIWDTSPQLQPKTTEADPDTFFGRFGGEGEGGHTHMIWPWKVGENFQFFVQKQKGADGKSTDARYYVFDRATQRWRHSATINSPIGGQHCVETIGGGVNSFLENFSGKNKDIPKLALYSLWLGTSVDELKPLTKAGGDGIWGQLNDTYFLAEGAEKKLEAVFQAQEAKYGKPVFGREGQKLPPISAKPLAAELVKALKTLPRADAVQERSDEPRDDATYIVRSAKTRKGIVVGRDGGAQQLTLSKARVVWRLNRVGDYFQIINSANGLLLDGAADQATLRRANGGASQLWSFVKAGDAYYIRCKEADRVLDLKGGSEDDGTPILMWGLKKPPGDSNQIWMLTEVKKK